MKTRSFFVFILLFCMTGTFSFAQQEKKSKKDLVIKKIFVNDFSKGSSGFEGFEPRGLSGLSTTSATAGKWAKIEVNYRSYPAWIDEVDLDVYVLTASSEPVLLKDRITQINVAKGPNHYAVVYLHPTTLARFGSIERVAVQISAKGKVLDMSQWPSQTKKEWWNELQPMAGYMKKNSQTPFLLDQPEKYEDTK